MLSHTHHRKKDFPLSIRGILQRLKQTNGYATTRFPWSGGNKNFPLSFLPPQVCSLAIPIRIFDCGSSSDSISVFCMLLDDLLCSILITWKKGKFLETEERLHRISLPFSRGEPQCHRPCRLEIVGSGGGCSGWGFQDRDRGHDHGLAGLDVSIADWGRTTRRSPSVSWSVSIDKWLWLKWRTSTPGRRRRRNRTQSCTRSWWRTTRYWSRSNVGPIRRTPSSCKRWSGRPRRSWSRSASGRIDDNNTWIRSERQGKPRFNMLGTLTKSYSSM